MQPTDVLIGRLLDDETLTLEELARACSVKPDWVVEHVQAGLFSDGSVTVSAQRFSSVDLRRARRMIHIERGYDAVPELAALVADMLEEMDQLRTKVRALDPKK
ncbi:MAG TPA: chaperone modulator CbpM [Bordetella sp.]|uniref:chaperone modulator CbpM n=1 Tax=Bordetella sp. TaxID=28081 RepID=UPI002ED60025